jgi:hypothetical protein
MRVYKGVAPGTHHAGNAHAGRPFASTTIDPILTGFHGSASMPQNTAAVLRHIVNYSWPSPFVSVSMSFAVAADYATAGGWVFEIVLPDDDVASVVINPIVELVKGFPHLHVHNGHQDLIHGIAAPALYAAILAKPPLAPGANGVAAPKPFAPAVTDPMTALVFAARDSELLLASVPAGWLVPQVHLVP